MESYFHGEKRYFQIKYLQVSNGNIQMQIIARCPKCNYTWRLDGSSADRRISCRKCGRLFKVPRLDDMPKAKAVIEQSKGDVYVDEKGKTFG